MTCSISPRSAKPSRRADLALEHDDIDFRMKTTDRFDAIDTGASEEETEELARQDAVDAGFFDAIAPRRRG